jgi:hypothetical protein
MQIFQTSPALVRLLLVVPISPALDFLHAPPLWIVLASGETIVVQAQITGSIVATSLFGLGLAILAGRLRPPKQEFNPARVCAVRLRVFLRSTVVAIARLIQC